jgi:predicted alpha/beta superfamily hydrolase
MRIRCAEDWDKDVLPVAVTGGTRFEFEIESKHPFLYFKPVVAGNGDTVWSKGTNYLALAEAGTREVYPYFLAEDACTVCDVREVRENGTPVRYRVFSPPGYGENTLKRYPVVYMHDGQNVFFPHEAAFGYDWKMPETLTLLAAMNLIDKLLVVGVYPHDRERDYTLPGYGTHAQRLVERLKPQIDKDFRSLRGPQSTAIMGSSLGGVAALHAAWQHPHVFGMAACLSSTFGLRDDLRERIARERKPPLRIYLDSGWPGDNYEITRDMASLLTARGFEQGEDMLYFGFPRAHHDERHWAERVHLPLQFFFGRFVRPGPGSVAATKYLD